MSRHTLPALATRSVSNPRPNAPSAMTKAWQDMALLYVSKTGALLVGLVFLPAYRSLLGDTQFGVVAAVYAFQALLLVMDLGMSTLVGRDIAAGTAQAQARRALQAAEAVLTVSHMGLLVLALPVAALAGWSLQGWHLVLVMVFVWSLTVQNVQQSALLGGRRFADAALLQLGGVGGRALVTLAALHLADATLAVFLVAQTACALAQHAVTHLRVRRLLGAADHRDAFAGLPPAARAMAVRGLPLMVSGAAVAAVSQVDKLLVSWLTSPAALASYFLAATLSVAPLSALATPVAQFYQPRVVRAVAQRQPDQQRLLLQFVQVISVATLLPSALIWLLREPLINSWLHASPSAPVVTQYAAILLPGIAFNALSYVPFSMMVALQDFKFQARLSAGLALVMLLGVALAAHAGSIVGVCWVYSLYHVVAALASWARWLHLDRTDAQGCAPRAALRAAVLCCCTLLLTAAAAFAGGRALH
jgi:O-antigen/teichoic acid export membrane protein